MLLWGLTLVGPKNYVLKKFLDHLFYLRLLLETLHSLVNGSCFAFVDGLVLVLSIHIDAYLY